MATFTEWCRDTCTQLLVDIAPGASGWDAEVEGDDLQSRIEAAQITIGMDGRDQLSNEVRVVVVDRILHEGPGSNTKGKTRDLEKAMNRGLMLTALRDAEDYFDAEMP